MKFINTIAAAKTQQEKTWAFADGLVLDFKDAGVFQPTTLHYKEAVDALQEQGFGYDASTLQAYWRVASTFGPSRRRKGATVKVYDEIIGPLWSRLDPSTRSNELVTYATQFFAENKPATGKPLAGAYKARAWAMAMAANLDAERKAREEAAAKKALKERLAITETELTKAIEAGDMVKARATLGAVNEIRRRLGLELVKLDEEQAAVETDEEATEEAQQENDSERLHQEAKSAIEYAIARYGTSVAYLGNTYLREQEHLTLEDRDAYAEEIELIEGRSALIRAEFSGTTSDEALAAAVAQWASEATSGGGR